MSVAGGGLCFYFRADADHHEYSGIYRCDLETGKTARLVQNSNVAYVCAEGNTVTYGVTQNYYSSDVTFHRINADGAGDHALGLTLPSGEFLVDGEWVYYVDHDYAPVAGNPTHPMFKIKLDGTGKVDLHSGYVYDWNCFLLSDGWIYYWQSSVQWQDGWSMIGGDNSVNGVWRMRTDGSGKERVYDAYGLNGRISWAKDINALDGRLYFAVESIQFNDAGTFCDTFTVSSSLPGGSETVLANISAPNGIHFVDGICVMPGWLFYTVTRQRDDVTAANNPSVFDYEMRRYRFPLTSGQPQELSRHSWDESQEGDTITIEVPLG